MSYQLHRLQVRSGENDAVTPNHPGRPRKIAGVMLSQECGALQEIVMITIELTLLDPLHIMRSVRGLPYPAYTYAITLQRKCS